MEASDKGVADIEQESPLHQAAWLGDIATMERLIAEGTDINARTNWYDSGPFREVTPLMVAAASSEGASVETLAWLLDHGADLTARSTRGGTAAWYAAGPGERWWREQGDIRPGNVNRLRFLLDAGLNASEPLPDGRLLLCEACRSGSPACVRLLLERGASPHRGTDTPAPNNRYTIPLIHASKSGSVECIQQLLDAGADVNEATQRGATALMSATSPEVACLLIAAGADVNAWNDHRDVLGEVLEAASDRAEEGQPDAFAVADVLLEAGASLETGSKRGATKLDLMAFRYRAPAVEWLLAQGAYIAPDNKGSTSLHSACWNSGNNDICERIVRILVTAGISVNARDTWGTTPLHEAAGGDGGNIAAVRTLLELGAEPDPIDGSGKTPLHMAAFRGDLDCIKALLAHGVDPRRTDAKGRTPVDYAASMEQFLRKQPVPDLPAETIEEDEETPQERLARQLQEAEDAHTALIAASQSPWASP